MAFAKERRPDLVVVGSRGMGAAKSALMSLVGLGSVSGERARRRGSRARGSECKGVRRAHRPRTPSPALVPSLSLSSSGLPQATWCTSCTARWRCAAGGRRTWRCRRAPAVLMLTTRACMCLPLSPARTQLGARQQAPARSMRPNMHAARPLASPALMQRRPSARSWSPWTTATRASRHWRCGQGNCEEGCDLMR